MAHIWWMSLLCLIGVIKTVRAIFVAHKAREEITNEKTNENPSNLEKEDSDVNKESPSNLGKEGAVVNMIFTLLTSAKIEAFLCFLVYLISQSNKNHSS